MAPSRKRKSEAMEEADRPTTPTEEPARKKLRISEEQKQALIDNLQLEVTERARKLRAHYALQCADLRSRIERRVNRIPMAMRKITMAELMAKHATTSAKPQPTKPLPTVYSQVTLAASKERPLPALPQDLSSKQSSPFRIPVAAPTRGKKRKSSGIQILSDKDSPNEEMPMPKKTRGANNNKPTTTTNATRSTSRSTKATTGPSILSPRSHNSRTLPRSPLKPPTSPTKSLLGSPSRPHSPLKSAAHAASNAISASVHGMIEHTKRGAASAAGKLSRTNSRETKPPLNASASFYSIKAQGQGQMLPPPRPAFGAGTRSIPPSPQRTISASSNTTTSSETSTTSTATTVVKPKRGRPAAAAAAAKTIAMKASPKAGRGRTAATKQTTSSAAKKGATTTGGGGILKGKAGGANKKVVVAEPAAGRRVLRKRN